MPSKTDTPLLLDTHCLVWFVEGIEGMFSARSRESIRAATRGTGLCVSVMSFWEVALLVTKGRLRLSLPIDDWIALTLERLAPLVLDVTLPIALESTRLPNLAHADPIDRMLLATARVSDLILLTKDRVMLDYGCKGYVRTVDA